MLEMVYTLFYEKVGMMVLKSLLIPVTFPFTLLYVFSTIYIEGKYYLIPKSSLILILIHSIFVYYNVKDQKEYKILWQNLIIFIIGLIFEKHFSFVYLLIGIQIYNNSP